MSVSVHQQKKSVWYLETNIAKLAIHDKNLLNLCFFVTEENVLCLPVGQNSAVRSSPDIVPLMPCSRSSWKWPQGQGHPDPRNSL